MEIKFNSSKAKIKPFDHQVSDAQKLVDNPYFGLMSEMGTGKSATVIYAACTLAEAGIIDTVVCVCPASVRCVWLDREIGEIKKHAWMPSSVWEYHQKLKRVWENGTTGLRWIISNYEFLRSDARLAPLCVELLKRKTLLVLDESSYIKNRTAAQTKSAMKLRKHCARVVILNGTPITAGPMDLWSQANVLSPDILGKKYKNFYHFRNEFCEMQQMRFGARSFPQIKGYKNLDKLAGIIAPHIVRRLKVDCLSLPEKLYTEREVALTPESWKRYQELKKDALISLGESGEKRMEPNAAVRLMRLAQLTSGILGKQDAAFIEYIPSNPDNPTEPTKDVLSNGDCTTDDVSDEKLRWAVQYLTEECTAKAVIVWTRWRRERERLVEALASFEQKAVVDIHQLYGGQKQKERDLAVQLFSQAQSRKPRQVLIAQPHAGSHGLNLIAATEHIFLSNDFSLGVRLQAEDRSHRPGQVNPVTYIDVLATGPSGQKTIDHVIFKALREKKNIADLTCSEWRKELEEE